MATLSSFHLVSCCIAGQVLKPPKPRKRALLRPPPLPGPKPLNRQTRLTVVYKQITVKIVLLHLRQNWQGEGNFNSKSSSKHCKFETNFVSFQKIMMDKNYYISFSTRLLTKFRNHINKSTWYSIRQSQFLSSIVLSQNFVFISF